MAWAVWLGCTTAPRLAREWGITDNAARHKLKKAAELGELAVTTGRPNVYANASCKPTLPDITADMKAEFTGMPKLCPLPKYAGDMDRARAIMYDAAEGWATGAASWWARGANADNTLIRLQTENRVLDQCAFETILSLTYDYFI